MRPPAVVAVAAALLTLPLAARPAGADVTLIRGGAAIASFSHTSADGCVHTVGELAAVRLSGGDQPSGVYVTGSQEDVCAGTGNGFAGFSPASFTAVGLLFAHLHATVAAPSYSGGADVTFAVDLTWLGRGPISRSHDVWDDGSAINVQWSASRDAATTGALVGNGVAMTIDGATLAREVSGTITR